MFLGLYSLVNGDGSDSGGVVCDENCRSMDFVSVGERNAVYVT